MAITGLRHTTDQETGERPENYREGILLNTPNGDSPLTALTSVMKTEPTDDPVMHWFEKEHASQRLQLSEDLDATETAFDVVNDAFGGGTQVGINTVLHIEQTGELVRVIDTTPTGTLINVERGYAGSTAATVAFATQNPYMSVIGTVFPEAADSPEERAYLPTRRTNYTQIFRNTIGASRTAMRTRHRTGPVINEMKRESLLIHTNSIERAFFLGKGIEEMVGTAPRRACDGVYHVLAAVPGTPNIKLVPSGTLDLATLEEYMYEMFRYGSDEKMGFCGNRFVLSLNQAIRKDSGTQYQLAVGQKEYGMNVMRLTTPFGGLVLKRHPLFNEMVGDPSAGTPWYGLDSTCVVLDMAALRYRPLKGDDTRFIPDVQTPGKDGDKSEWLTECGLEINFANRHMWIQNAGTA